MLLQRLNKTTRLSGFSVVTAIIEIVYYNGQNKKSPWARSLNCAGNEYDFEYDFFKSMKNNENDNFLKYANL